MRENGAGTAPFGAAAGARKTAEKRVHVVQGEYCVSDDPEVMLTTLLGSCIAACLRDPVARVGGMNHFLLPGSRETGPDGKALRHGVHAMEVLLNALFSRGARRERLEAKLFGGARLIEGLTDIGSQNAAFAEHFLREEDIPLVGSSLRGEYGRKIQFWPATGRARQALMGSEATQIFEVERRIRPLVPPAADGSVELF